MIKKRREDKRVEKDSNRQHVEHRRISVPADRMEHRDDSTAISRGQEVRSH